MITKTERETTELIGKMSIVNKAMRNRAESPLAAYQEFVFFLKRNVLLVVFTAIAVAASLFFLIRAIVTFLNIFG